MARREIKPPFKIPTIIRNHKGDWYIQYYYEHPDIPRKWVPFKIRDGLNYIKDPVIKEREYGFLRDDVESWLKAGNGPYDYITKIKQEVKAASKKVDKIIAAYTGWKIADAEREYLQHITLKGLAYNTVRTYKKYVRMLRTWCDANDYSQKPLSKFTEFDLEEFLNECAEDNAWSGRTYNNYLKYFGGFFNKVRLLEKRDNKRKGLTSTIVYEIDVTDIEKRTSNMQRNKAYTPALADTIKAALQEPGRENLKDYIEWIYFSMMRPHEIRHLKVSQVNIQDRQIRLVGKTGDRLVPISDGLMNVISRRGLTDSPQKHFIFGMMGNVSARRISVAYFLEQYTDLKRDIGTDTKLGPYNWKHTAVQRMTTAGYEEEEIMVLTGHKTKDAFRSYKADFVIDKGHLMKGRTIDF